jgi:hypothetical protein
MASVKVDSVSVHPKKQRSETSRLPNFLENRLTDGSKDVSVTPRPHFRFTDGSKHASLTPRPRFSLKDGSKDVSLTPRSRFTSHVDSWYSFL